jgi:hypothetical protein
MSNILKVLKKYPVITSLGTVTTLLYIYGNENKDFYLNIFRNRVTLNHYKERRLPTLKEFSNNIILQVFPITGFEWRIFLITLYLCAPRLERMYGLKFFLTCLIVNAVISTLDEKEIKEEQLYNPFAFNMAINTIFWTTRVYQPLDPNIECLAYLFIAYLFTLKDYKTDFGIVSTLFLNAPLRFLKIKDFIDIP